MGLNTHINYATHTLNLWWGCTKVSEGCKHCYMYRDAGRWGKDASRVVRTSNKTWHNVDKMQPGDIVFVNSISDFLHPAADDWRADAWRVIESRPDLFFIILTKRPGRFWGNLPDTWGDGGWPNVMLAVSGETQPLVDDRLQHLFKVPAHSYGLSLAPLLEGVDLGKTKKADCHLLDWVVVEGESNHVNQVRQHALEYKPMKSTQLLARPVHPHWALKVLEYCELHNIAFNFKQWGVWAPIGPRDGIDVGDICLSDNGFVDVWADKGQVCFANESDGTVMRAFGGVKAAGRALYGREYNGIPTMARAMQQKNKGV